ncbi:MAG TPA: GTPase Era [Ignavibacteria bacterium]
MNKDKIRSGYVAIVGRPNSGKSTLLNAFLRQELSVVTAKAQTTRNRIQGILTHENTQIIFLDTPGILEPKYELQSFMLSEILTSLRDSDLVLYLIDSERFNPEELKKSSEILKANLSEKKLIIALNKIDLRPEVEVKKMMVTLSETIREADIIPISALEDFNIEKLLEKISEYLPESPFLYDEAEITDKPEKFFAAEIIRQKILQMYGEEIPYSVFVDVREFKEREYGKDFINADIVVERESQKIIIIGKKGDKIKSLGERARKEIEKFLGRQVYLQLFVKIRKDWRKDKNFLKSNF